jgi:hypothetical protein
MVQSDTNVSSFARVTSEAASMKQSEAQNSRYDQEECDNVIQELGHDQNKNTSEQGDDWLEMGDAECHVACAPKRMSSKGCRLCR